MKNNRTRLLALLLSTVMVVASITGCGKDKTADDVAEKVVPTEAKTEKKDSINIATMSETPSMNPYAHNATAGSYMDTLVYSTLFITDENTNPIPSLVDTWENTSDTEWVFTLKPGVKFHDGSAMTAADVVASIAYSKTFTEASQYTASIASAEAIDDLKVKITTDGPSATILYDLCNHALCVVPKALIDAGNDFNKNPIGSGPYVFKKWTLGDNITFESFDDYFGTKPAIKNMTWKIIPEGSSRTIALEAGEIDMIIEVEGMDVERIKEHSDLTLLQHDAAQVSWLILNNEKPGLNNVNLRHAINSAIDKESLVTVALNGNGKVALSQTPAGLAGESIENADVYDVAKAKEYLAASGVNPAEVKLSIICSNDVKKRAAEVIQANLKEIGIDCQIESMDLATYLSNTIEGNFTGSVGGYSSTNMSTILSGVYHSKMLNSSNLSRIQNPEIDALIDKAAATVDAEARNAVMQQANALLNKDCPNIPLYQEVNIRAFNSKLQGVSLNAGGLINFENISWAE